MWILGVLVSIPAPWKNLMGTFWYHLRGKLNKVLENSVPRAWDPQFWSCKHKTIRASFKPHKVLENLVLRPWHPEFSRCRHEFWGKYLFNVLSSGNHDWYVLFKTLFRAIEKIELYWTRLTFHLVEPRPKSKSVVKCLKDPPHPGQSAGEPGLLFID